MVEKILDLGIGTTRCELLIIGLLPGKKKTPIQDGQGSEALMDQIRLLVARDATTE